MMRIKELKECFGWMSEYNRLVFFLINNDASQINYFHNTFRNIPLPVSVGAWESKIHEKDIQVFKGSLEQAREDGKSRAKYRLRINEGDQYCYVQQRTYYLKDTNAFTGMLVDLSHMAPMPLGEGESDVSEDVEKLILQAAHDLRGPFKSALGLSGLMVREISGLRNNEVRGKMQSYIKRLTDIATFSLSVTDDLLNMFKLKRKNGLDVERVNPVDFMEEYIETLRNLFPDRELQLMVQGGVSPDLMVYLNDTAFKRSILNLVANANKFSPSEAPVVLGVRELMEHIEFYVQDRGTGIDPKEIEKVFSKEGCTGRTGLNGEQSYGLGLAMVREIVELHKGNVVINSEEGKGATFSIVLRKHFRPSHGVRKELTG